MGDRPVKHTYQPNVALQALYSKFFDSIQVDEAWIHSVRRLSSQGTVVYVLRNLNFVDFLALDHLTKRFSLPEIRFANDLGVWLWNPLGGGLARALLPGRVSPADELRDAIEHGGSAALFLKRPPGVLDVATGASGGRGLREGDDLVRTLVDLQRERPSRPILLVPQVFVWTKRPDTRGTHALDFLLGPREWPNPVRTVGQFFLNYRNVELKAGEPLNLAQYLDGAPTASDDVHVRRIVYAVLRRLERERRSVTGPAEKPPDRVRDELVRSPKLRAAIKQLAENGEDRAELTERVATMLRKLQASPDRGTIGALAVLLDRIFHRIYAGIDVDREGLRRVREASKEGSIVLLPSHKSHIDYLVVSYVFNEENLSLPLIAAGDNLSFFPLGPVFRHAGAFFIRRSFKGDKLYAAVVHTYVRRLIRDGFPIEVFVEGGRSRTGKLLPPKFGLLGMIIEAALSIPQREVFFVPVSIGYERIVETGAYEKELSGGEKVKEDAAGLLKTTRVLQHRYGRINLQFGTILTLNEIRDDLGIARGGELRPPQRRAVVTRLGNRVVDEINRVTAVTPGALTALALLSHGHRGLPHDDLVDRTSRLLTVLQESGARVTPSTVTPSGNLRPEAIREAAQLFTDALLVVAHAPAEPDAENRTGEDRVGHGTIYTIPDNRRLELDTSKNMIVHFFVERSLVSVGLLVDPGPPSDKNLIRDRVQRLSRIFKHEFRFRADAPFDEIFDETIERMRAAGEVVIDPDGRLNSGPGRLGWSGREWLLTYAAFLRNFLEGYRIAARGLGVLTKGPMPEKELIKKTLATGKRMFFTGEIERQEAVSQPLVKNALAFFADQETIRSRDGKVELVTPTPEAVRAAEMRIVSFFDKAVPE